MQAFVGHPDHRKYNPLLRKKNPVLREFPWLFAIKSARNEGAAFATKRAMQQESRLKVTLPNLADDGLIDGMF